MKKTMPLTDLVAESELLDNIKAGNLTKVEEFVANFPLLRLCYGNRQVCALEYSIDCNRYKIYAYLRSKGFYTDKGKKLKAKIQNLSNSQKEKIRVENLKHVVCNPEAFIGIILSKCSFDSQSSIADVREMLLQFKEIYETNSMFPTIAHADLETIFDYKSKSARTMDSSSVYEKIIETSFNILSSQYPQKPAENQEKTVQLHQFIAICLFFSEELANLLGLNHDEGECTHKKLARCGLIKYDKDGKFHFKHLTYAGFFIALFIFHFLKTVKKLSQVQLDLIFQVLTSKKFKITRMFLDSMLNQVEKVQHLKCFNSSLKICEKVKNKKNFLNFSVDEGLFNNFEFFALAIKKYDVELFKEVIELKDGYEATNLMRILPHATNLTKFKNFLREILRFYGENIFDDFLLKVDNDGDTILHYFAIDCKNNQIIECFWNKIKVFFTDESNLRSFLLVKGNYERNALMTSIAQKNETSFYFLFEQVFCKFFNIKDFAYETDEKGENLLHYLARYGSLSMLKFTLKKLKKKFSREDFQNFINLKNKNGENILHCAARQNENQKSVEFIVDFIDNEVGSEEVKKMLSDLDDCNRLPLHGAVEFSNLKMFEFFFSLYEKSFSQVQILQFLRAKDKNGDNLLHCVSANSKSQEVFEFACIKIEKLFEDKEELKEFLLVKGLVGRNALMWSIADQTENPFYFLFEQVLCKFFNIKEFAYETDEFGENLLHYLARYDSVSRLEFALQKLKREFSPEDFQDFIKSKNKNGLNLLHCAALQNENEKSVEFLVDFIENEFGSKEVKKMLSELDKFMRLPLHCAVAFNNLKVFEFLFSIYVKNFTKFEIERFIKIVALRKSIFEQARDNTNDTEMFETVKLAFREYHVEKTYCQIL